ncbi:stage II sporulation protein R [Bacillus sp. CGMCC 1.16541]|uniref:stage II sporulation protein R n=1 Tax=Bacillus sp. CGMCC 1.16541 TaxID=2185143 RepID=UPI000D72746A|nr:stage II sporulation protein R [Bacillus sp. CGMCC 1.16541]
MKKQVIIYFILLLIGAHTHLLYTSQEVQANEPMVIPDEAIRLRILANSDADEDQHVKRLIRDRVNAEITEWVQELTSVEEARRIIRGNLDEIESIAQQVLKEENVNQSVTVDFGKVSFPTKLYGQFLYPAGEYEAILISLGEAEGANWWCVLFPPLCFLDFSNGEAVQEPLNEEEQAEVTEEPQVQQQEVEVKFFLVEWFTKIFS